MTPAALIHGITFLDFEASSLAPDSWPIEVGLSWIDHNLQVQTYHSLIQPVPEWPEHAWSWQVRCLDCKSSGRPSRWETVQALENAVAFALM